MSVSSFINSLTHSFMQARSQQMIIMADRRHSMGREEDLIGKREKKNIDSMRR